LDLIKSITLGVVQGITEFLPISSTAHLKIIPALLHWPDPGAAASAVIQLGTVAAVLIYFAKDLIQITTGFLKSFGPAKPGVNGDIVDPKNTLEARLGRGIILGTIPICVLGLLLKKVIEHSFRGMYVIAGAMIVMALVLYAADILTPKKRSIESITVKDCLIVGLMQCLALIPGSSRSGSTMAGAFLTGLNREAAARFSFLLSVPATALAGLLELKDVIKPPAPEPGVITMHWTSIDLVVATLVSGIVGYISIAWLIKLLRTHTTIGFVIYRILVGIALYVMVSKGLIAAQ